MSDELFEPIKKEFTVPKEGFKDLSNALKLAGVETVIFMSNIYVTQKTAYLLLNPKPKQWVEQYFKEREGTIYE